MTYLNPPSYRNLQNPRFSAKTSIQFHNLLPFTIAFLQKAVNGKNNERKKYNPGSPQLALQNTLYAVHYSYTDGPNAI